MLANIAKLTFTETECSCCCEMTTDHATPLPLVVDLMWLSSEITLLNVLRLDHLSFYVVKLKLSLQVGGFLPSVFVTASLLTISYYWQQRNI